MNRSILILLADDHTMVRETLRDRLNAEPDMTVVADVGTTDQAVAEAKRHKPDIVLLDIDMPGLLCFQAAATIKTENPATRVIFLSAYFHDNYIEEALAVEASGYITKGETTESITAAIRTVAAGATYYSPEVQSRIMVDSGTVRLSQQARTRVSTLTPRELEVLRYIARGLSKKEIAGIMDLRVKTIDCHSSNLMTKLDIHDRVELARFAIREGLAEV